MLYSLVREDGFILRISGYISLVQFSIQSRETALGDMPEELFLILDRVQQNLGSVHTAPRDCLDRENIEEIWL